MDQYDYLSREQLLAMLRAPGAGGEPARGDDGELPEFGDRARHEFEASASPMRIFDHATLRYLAVNDAAVKFYGYTREEFLALTLKDTRHPDEHAAQLASLEKSTNYLRHGGARRQFKKSGEIVVAEVVTQDVMFNGRRARLSLTIDITGRLRTQELLWRRQQEFESLAENLPDLVARFDRDRRFLYVNSAIERVLGVNRGQILDRTQRELGLPEELVSLFDDSLAGVFATGQPHQFDFRMGLPGGERLYEAHHVAEFDASGCVSSVLCVARDITERKRNEQTLRDTNEFLQSVIESSRDCIKVLDLDGRLNLISAGGLRLLEIDDQGPLLGTSWLEFWNGSYRAAAQAALDAARGGGVGKFEGFCRTQKGADRWWDVLVTPIPDAAGRPVCLLAVSRDVTERKRSELKGQRSADLARLLEALARAVNEAVTPEAAMVACLERICAYGGWAIGRVAIYGEDGPRKSPARSFWHAADPGRFADLIEFSRTHVARPGGGFISRLLGERLPVWIEDIDRTPGFARKPVLVRSGLRSAFGFPIIVHGNIVAIMEVFSETVRPQDPLTMGAAQSIASQLARIIEREVAHQADARMAVIVESSQDAIMSRTLDGTILTWNPAAERLFGYTAAEIVGRNIDVLYPPGFMPELFQRQQLLLERGSVPNFESVRLTKDGRRIHVSTSPALVRDSSGAACGVSVIVRDITGRKLAEQELLEYRQRLEWILNETGVGTWLNPLPLTKLNWDRRTRELFFVPDGVESTVDIFWERLHPDDREPTRLAVEAALRDRTVYAMDHRVVHPRTGEIRWIRSAGKAAYAADGTACLFDGINYDITDRKRQEQEQLNHAAIQRDALVREVHHRIKNNLQGVIGLLRQKIRKNPAITVEIQESIAQLQSVALVYGLQETRTDGLLNLADLVDAICASAESLIGGRVDRHFERRTRPACVSGPEAVSVAVALNELVFNALKHQSVRAGRKVARLMLRETTGGAEIRISNRGRLPEGFDYPTGRKLGNGLGIVRTLLAFPGGGIEFSNGRGRVEVRLKLAPPLLAGRQQWLTRRRNDGGSGKKKAAAARAGRGRRPAGAGRAG